MESQTLQMVPFTSIGVPLHRFWLRWETDLSNALKRFQKYEKTSLEITFGKRQPCDSKRAQVKIQTEEKSVTISFSIDGYVNTMTLKNFAEFPRNRNTGEVLLHILRDIRLFDEFYCCLVNPT